MAMIAYKLIEFVSETTRYSKFFAYLSSEHTSGPTATNHEGLVKNSRHSSEEALRNNISITRRYYNNISLPGRNAGIYTKEASVSAANLLLSQGDRHPAIPIISCHHLSRP
jgi:hypothetical protein